MAEGAKGGGSPLLMLSFLKMSVTTTTMVTGKVAQKNKEKFVM